MAEPALRGDGAARYLQRQRGGDTTDVVLDYLGYNLDDLRTRYHDAAQSAALPPAAEAETVLRALNLTGYTYLQEE